MDIETLVQISLRDFLCRQSEPRDWAGDGTRHDNNRAKEQSDSDRSERQEFHLQLHRPTGNLGLRINDRERELAALNWSKCNPRLGVARGLPGAHESLLTRHHPPREVRVYVLDA